MVQCVGLLTHLNENGQNWVATGIQHEMDHLNGKTILEEASRAALEGLTIARLAQR